MKFRFGLLLLAVALPAAVLAGSPAREQAIQLLIAEADTAGAGLSEVFLTAKPLPAGSRITSYRGEPITLAADAWFGFVDDAPGANWDHPCRYILIDAASGLITVEHRRTPPAQITSMAVVRPGRTPARPVRPAGRIEGPGPRAPDRVNPERLWAVIISGGASQYSNYPRYWNDSSQIYKALADMYGYLDDHIYAAVSDGTDPAPDKSDGTNSNPDLDGDGDADITHSCSIANLTTIFTELAGRAGPNDLVFVYSTDHGSQESGHDALLNLYFDQELRDDQFAAYLNQLAVRDIVVTMEQCFSGGFLEDTIDGGASQRVFSSAANWDEYSWAMGPDYVWDTYVYYWTAAVYWQYPDGTPVDADTNDDGIVDMHEAFIFAEAHDMESETPQYGDQPAGHGDTVSLFGSGPSSEGEVVLDRGNYACQDSVAIEVGDLDLAGQGSLAVNLASTSLPAGISVNLTESDEGMFAGTAVVSTSPGAGELEVAEGDTITATYQDADYGGGGPMTVTAEAMIDCLPPVFSNVIVTEVTGESALVSWTTDEPATSTVRYGETVPPQLVAGDEDLLTSHAVLLEGLGDCTFFFFQVESTDEAGNAGLDDNGGSYYTLLTLERQVMLEANMDTNPGWTISGGQWAWGQPTGNLGDPSSGWTGDNVYGYNLNGAYPDNMAEYTLTTPSMDCSEAPVVGLSFYRWLGVESNYYDHARVQISVNGGSSWSNVWENGADSMQDTSWQPQEFDLSTWAAGQADVRLRWTMGPTDSSVTYSGWNIDDVLVMYETDCDLPTPTPFPTFTPLPTETPAPTATPVFTATPEPTATPELELGVRIEMPSLGHPGEDFYVTGYLDNPGAPMADVPTFFILAVYGEYWFWPSWKHFVPPDQGEIDFEFETVPTGSRMIEVVPHFDWPAGPDQASGLYFYGAMLDTSMTGIMGEMAVVEWGFGPR